MVNHGASNACLTCKQRRVRCDERQPGCARCATHGVTCGGYRKKPVTIRFKTQKLNIQHSSSSNNNAGSSVNTPNTAQPHEPDENLAINFFINGFALAGRSLETSRGFFESIIPILNAAGSTSAVSVATTAVSALLLNRWKRSAHILSLSRIRLGEALQKLQADLKEPVKRRDEATLLSVLMLQCYENARATFRWDNPRTVHQDGAFSLIKTLGLNAFQSVHAKRLLLYMLNAEVTAALREGRSIDPDIRRWAESAAEIPWNLSSRLDYIGIRLAELQENFVEFQTSDSESTTALVGQLVEILNALKLWTGLLPDLWQPVRFRAQKQLDPPIQMYLDTYDIYPTVEIASIWNTWRNYSLIAFSLQYQLEEQLYRHSPPSCGMTESKVDHNKVQGIVDSLCYSIPFYLGNRSRPSAMENSVSVPIVFPSFYTLHLFGNDLGARSKYEKTMTGEETYNNATNQGAWQLTPILRSLISTLSKPSSHLLRAHLRDGQLRWIQQQMVRVSRLFGTSLIESAKPIDSNE